MNDDDDAPVYHVSSSPAERGRFPEGISDGRRGRPARGSSSPAERGRFPEFRVWLMWIWPLLGLHPLRNGDVSLRQIIPRRLVRLLRLHPLRNGDVSLSVSIT